jgi:hypothetical protein
MGLALFDAAEESLDSAQQLVSELQQGTVPPGTAARLHRLEVLLTSVAQQLTEASAVCDRQSRRIEELSSVVVGSTARHF